MNQLADNKKLMDFLLYSYFGFSSGDLDQTRKLKCSYRAYLDLARTVKYPILQQIWKKQRSVLMHMRSLIFGKNELKMSARN